MKNNHNHNHSHTTVYEITLNDSTQKTTFERILAEYKIYAHKNILELQPRKLILFTTITGETKQTLISKIKEISSLKEITDNTVITHYMQIREQLYWNTYLTAV